MYDTYVCEIHVCVNSVSEVEVDLGHRLSYSNFNADAFGASHNQRKLGKQLYNQLKQSLQGPAACQDRTNRVSKATAYLIKHLGADITFKELHNRPELS